MDVQDRAIFVGGYEVVEADVDYLNYVEKGFVTQVLNQGSFLCPLNPFKSIKFSFEQGICGSCWAFAR